MKEVRTCEAELRIIKNRKNERKRETDEHTDTDMVEFITDETEIKGRKKGTAKV